MSRSYLRMFKLNHEQLAKMLPASAFESLDTALPVVCKAMCLDERFGAADVRPGLEYALQVLTKPQVAVLKDIRDWALEFLRDSETANNNSDLLSGPLECPQPSVDSNFESRTRQLTAKQARGILANAFWANCRDAVESQKDSWNRGGLDWRNLLAERFGTEGRERMRCHLLYFETSATSEDDLDRRITFERIRYQPLDFFGSSVQGESPPVGNGVALHDNVMEHPSRPCSAFVNFANRNFGFGKFISSCTQEEILVSCCPEFTVGMLWIGTLGEAEVVNVSNVRRYAKYSGYLDSFQCRGPLEDVVVQDILTMDACYDGHFANANIQRDLNKAYAAFRAHKEKAKRNTESCRISTGKWGCGAFGGTSTHKFVQQVLAAHVAGVELDFSVFGDAESCDVILATLNECKATAGQVARALHVCKNRMSFVEDFQATLRSEAKKTSNEPQKQQEKASGLDGLV